MAAELASTSDARPTTAARLATLAVTSLTFIVLYNLTNWLSAQRSVGTAAFEWERHIPLIPWMIVPYWSIDLFFVAAPFFCSSTQQLRALGRRIVLAIVIASIFFLLFPLQLAFQREPVPGIPGVLFDALFSFDQVHNLAPSLHIALRTILWTVYIPLVRGIPQIGLKAWFFLVGISTLFCHQHQVIDLITGQLLGLFVLHVVTERNPAGTKGMVSPRKQRLGLCYLAASMICLGLTILFWPLGVIFIWPVLSLVLVAAAYLSASPKLFRKREGQYSPATRWLLAPYTYVAWHSYLYFTQGRPAYAEIIPGIFMGRRLTPPEAHDLRRRHIKAVLDLGAEYEEVAEFREVNYCNVPVLDLTPPERADYAAVVSFMERAIADGPIYVHCSLGLSRSVLAVAAFLVKKHYCKSAADALDLIRLQRSDLVVNDEARRSLEEFLDERGRK